MSLWQIAQAATRTPTSPKPGPRRVSSSVRSGSPNAWHTAALIVEVVTWTARGQPRRKARGVPFRSEAHDRMPRARVLGNVSKLCSRQPLPTLGVREMGRLSRADMSWARAHTVELLDGPAAAG